MAACTGCLANLGCRLARVKPGSEVSLRAEAVPEPRSAQAPAYLRADRNLHPPGLDLGVGEREAVTGDDHGNPNAVVVSASSQPLVRVPTAWLLEVRGVENHGAPCLSRVLLVEPPDLPGPGSPSEGWAARSTWTTLRQAEFFVTPRSREVPHVDTDGHHLVCVTHDHVADVEFVMGRRCQGRVFVGHRNCHVARRITFGIPVGCGGRGSHDGCYQGRARQERSGSTGTHVTPSGGSHDGQHPRGSVLGG